MHVDIKPYQIYILMNHLKKIEFGYFKIGRKGWNQAGTCCFLREALDNLFNS